MLLDYLNVSGSKTHVLSLAEELRRNGAKVYITGTRGAFSKVFSSRGFSVYHINFYGSGSKVREKLKKFIKEKNIQLMHAHQLLAVKYAGRIAEKYNIPLITTFHGTYYPEKRIIRAAKKSSALISCSPAVSNYLLENYKISTVLIPNGINLSEFYYQEDQHQLKKKLRIPGASPVVLYPSRQEGGKLIAGLNLMEACYEIRKKAGIDVHCIFAGTGAGSKKVLKTAEYFNEKSGVPFIHVIGRYYDMPSLHSVSTVTVASGRSAIEAMACGRPLIAAGAKGFVGLVSPDKYELAWLTGFGDHKNNLLPACTPSRLYTALREVLLSPHLAAYAGNRGREWVRKNYDESSQAKRIVKLYAAALNNKQ